MTNQNSTQAESFDPQAAIDQHRRDLLEALEKPTPKEQTSVAVKAIASILYIKKHKSPPPDNAIPTAKQIDRRWDDLGAIEQAKLTGQAIAAFAPKRPIEGEYTAALAELVAFSEGFARMIDNNHEPIEAHLAEAIPSGMANQRFKFQNWTDSLVVELHQRWLFWREYPHIEPTGNPFVDGINRAQEPPQRHFLSPVIEAWQNRPRSIETASVDHVNNLTPIPYSVSEVNRHQWEVIGSVDVVLVDGQPLASKMPSFGGGGNRVALKPKGTHGQIELPFFQPRNPEDKPIVLVAFEDFGGDLRKSIASDTAFFLWLIFASNHNLRLTDRQGAQLLARDKDGNFRRVTQTDLRRFQDVYFALRSLGRWIYDPDVKIDKYFEIVKADRESRSVVNLRQPAWFQRESGLWTLSAGFGGAGTKRLSMRANDGGIWRYIAGIEYWLARDSWGKKGPNKGIANALLPAQGKTGAGQWVELDWVFSLWLRGDRWDVTNTREHNKAKRRMSRLREYLKEAGYVTDLGKREAEAGDTIEFNFDRRGKVLVRATARFVEGARKAQKQNWETIGLMDYLTP
ncbi:MAG: hypothetical protein F4Y39_08630 [Gemmatimonadetes bacterium]|nr:hypothetical protein [Gemmatimonadota bacterium]MYK51689.1 hypothetical protein [Gemmatimonadota bacterium]